MSRPGSHALQTAPKFRKRKKLIDDGVVEDDDDVPLEDKELTEYVPWELWRTLLDKLSSFTPFQMLDFFFVRHSTGPSYTYLLFCALEVALLVGLVVTRKFNDPNLEDTQWEFPSQNEDVIELGFDPFVLPPNTGVLVTTGQSVVNTSAYSFQTCSQSVTFDDIQRGACSDVTPRTCSLGQSSTLGDFLCFPSDVDLKMEGTPFEPFFEGRNWRYLRIRVILPFVTNQEVTVHFRGVNTNDIVTEREDILAEDFRFVTINESWTVYPNQQLRTTFYYEPVQFNRLARWLVNSDQIFFVRYKKVEPMYLGRANYVDSTFVWEAVFRLDDQKRIVMQMPVSWLDIVAQISALILLLWVIGFIVRVYNKWHFLNYGLFESADLPEFYIDSLFDPVIPFSTPGLKEMVAMKNDRRKRTHRRDVEALHVGTSKVRKFLNRAIDTAQRAKEEERKAAAARISSTQTDR